MDRFTNMFCGYCKKLPAYETIKVTLNNGEIRKSIDGGKTWLREDGTMSNYII